MKKSILTICSFVALYAKAQDLNTHYQYQMNWMNVNTAYMGDKEGTTFILNPGTQWVGVAGNPTNSLFAVTKQLANNNGIGVKAVIDSRGIFNNFTVEGLYKYQAKINEQSALNFGVSAGYYQTYLQRRDVVGDLYTDQNDVTFTSENYNSAHFLAGFGMQYTFKKFDIGVSLPHLVVSNRPLSNHIFAMTKYSVALNDDFSVIPSVVFQYLDKSPYLLDGGLAVDWKNTLWLKGTYRTNGNVLAGLGVHVKDFMVGYTYTAIVGDFKSVAARSHEVFLSFTIKGNGRNRFLGESRQRRANQNLTQYIQEVQVISNKSTVNEEIKAELSTLQLELQDLLKKSSEGSFTTEDKKRMNQIEDKIEELKTRIEK